MDGFWIRWLDLLHLYTQLVTTINYRAIALSTLYNLLLHHKCPQSSIVYPGNGFITVSL
jgi:hypothetical protein